MPQVPGIPRPKTARRSTGHRSWAATARSALALLAALAGGIALAWMTQQSPRHASPAANPVEVAEPASLPNNASEPRSGPDTSLELARVASVQELAKPWSVKRFTYYKQTTNEPVPAILVRLPGAADGKSSAYWAFSIEEPYSHCELEYITDLRALASRFSFAARHPMVVDPCTRTIYDPLSMGTVPGGTWARGEVVQGSAIRPPLGIDVRVEGNRLIAGRME